MIPESEGRNGEALRGTAAAVEALAGDEGREALRLLRRVLVMVWSFSACKLSVMLIRRTTWQQGQHGSPGAVLHSKL